MVSALLDRAGDGPRVARVAEASAGGQALGPEGCAQRAVPVWVWREVEEVLLPVSAQASLLPELVPPLALELRDVVWGIDPSVRRIAVGMLAPGVEVGWRTLSLEQGHSNASRLWKAVGVLPGWFEQLRDDETFGRPRLVVVEQPFSSGRHVPHESLHMVGIVLAALWGALGLGSELVMLNPSEWKSRGLGKGRGFAKKPAILAWARSAAGYEGTCATCGDGLQPHVGGKRAGDCTRPSAAHDEADALGMATAGGVLLELRRS